MDGIESVPVETSDPVLTESLFSQLAHAIKNNIHDEIEPLRKKLDELTLKKQTTEKPRETSEKSELAPGVENQILKVRACRTIEDLCIYGELTMYRYQSKLTCDICDEDTRREVRKMVNFHMTLK